MFFGDRTPSHDLGLRLGLGLVESVPSLGWTSQGQTRGQCRGQWVMRVRVKAHLIFNRDKQIPITTYQSRF